MALRFPPDLQLRKRFGQTRNLLQSVSLSPPAQLRQLRHSGVTLWARSTLSDGEIPPREGADFRRAVAKLPAGSRKRWPERRSICKLNESATRRRASSGSRHSGSLQKE